MLKIFEKLDSWYYTNSDEIMKICSILFVLLIVASYVALKRKGKWTYSVFDCIRVIKYGIFALWIKFVVLILNIEIELNFPFSNLAFFIVLICSILIFEVIQGVFLRKLKVPVLQACKYFRIVIVFEIYFLVAIRCLDILDVVVGMLSLICLDMLPMLLSAMEEKKVQKNSKKSDCPNADLFYKREVQLNRFIPVLKDLKSEPYAILISGEWGVGKTSFIKAMERKLDNDVFIWLYAGSEKSVSEIMQEVSNNIINVLKRNRIIIENVWMIEKYFLSFVDAWNEKGGKVFRRIAELFMNEESINDKEFLNEKLRELDKTIYLIVDDLDRCTPEYQGRMFKALRESIELVNCKVLFLVDDKKFLENDRNYIEKYVSYTLELCEVSYEELVLYFVDDIIDEQFIGKINDVLLKGRTGRQVKEMIIEYCDNLTYKFKRKREEKEVVLKDNRRSEEEKETEKENLKDIKNVQDIIKNNSKNARKVKKFLKGIKHDINKLNDEIKKCSKSYQKEDWIKAVIQVQFFRYMMPDLFYQIRINNFMEITETDNRKPIIEIMLETDENGIKEDILNHIIYCIDTIDTYKLATDKERYLNELKVDPTMEHVKEYLFSAETYEEICKIIRLCEISEFHNEKDREVFIETLLEKISKWSIEIQMEDRQMQVLSQRILDCLKYWNLSKSEKNICERESRIIIRRILIGHSDLFHIVLWIEFPYKNVEEEWHSVEWTDINTFCDVLRKLDKNSKYGYFEKKNSVSDVRKFYKKLGEKLQEYGIVINIDLIRTFKDIDRVFEICEIWENIGKQLNTEDKNRNSFKMYYWKEYFYTKKVFENIDSFQEAIDELGKFYEEKKEKYSSEYSGMLVCLVRKLLAIHEENPEWIGNENREIRRKVETVANKCYRYDKQEDSRAREQILELKILMYNLNKWIIKGEQ